jgi:hypothetical protein
LNRKKKNDAASAAIIRTRAAMIEVALNFAHSSAYADARNSARATAATRTAPRRTSLVRHRERTSAMISMRFAGGVERLRR